MGPATAGSRHGQHVESVRVTHARDVVAGFGRVVLPDALECKRRLAPRRRAKIRPLKEIAARLVGASCLGWLWGRLRSTSRIVSRTTLRPIHLEPMKTILEPTLSAHLLKEASRFFFCPHSGRRSRAHLSAVQSLDQFGRRLVEWPQTFAPRHLDAVANEKLNDGVFLDEFYFENCSARCPRSWSGRRA